MIGSVSAILQSSALVEASRRIAEPLCCVSAFQFRVWVFGDRYSTTQAQLYGSLSGESSSNATNICRFVTLLAY